MMSIDEKFIILLLCLVAIASGRALAMINVEPYMLERRYSYEVTDNLSVYYDGRFGPGLIFKL